MQENMSSRQGIDCPRVRSQHGWVVAFDGWGGSKDSPWEGTVELRTEEA